MTQASTKRNKKIAIITVALLLIVGIVVTVLLVVTNKKDVKVKAKPSESIQGDKKVSQEALTQPQPTDSDVIFPKAASVTVNLGPEVKQEADKFEIEDPKNIEETRKQSEEDIRKQSEEDIRKQSEEDIRKQLEEDLKRNLEIKRIEDDEERKRNLEIKRIEDDEERKRNLEIKRIEDERLLEIENKKKEEEEQMNKLEEEQKRQTELENLAKLKEKELKTARQEEIEANRQREIADKLIQDGLSKENEDKIQKVRALATGTFTSEFDQEISVINELFNNIVPQILDEKTLKMCSTLKDHFLKCIKPFETSVTPVDQVHKIFEGLYNLDYFEYKDFTTPIFVCITETEKHIRIIIPTAQDNELFKKVRYILREFLHNYTMRISKELNIRFKIYCVLGKEHPYSPAELLCEKNASRPNLTKSQQDILEAVFNSGIEWFDLENDIKNFTNPLHETDTSDSEDKNLFYLKKIAALKQTILFNGLWETEFLSKRITPLLADLSEKRRKEKVLPKLEYEEILGLKNAIHEGFVILTSCRNIIMGLTIDYKTREIHKNAAGCWLGILEFLHKVKIHLSRNALNLQKDFLRYSKTRDISKNNKSLETLANGELEKIQVKMSDIMSVLESIQNIEMGKLFRVWTTLSDLEPKLYKLMEIPFKLYELDMLSENLYPKYKKLLVNVSKEYVDPTDLEKSVINIMNPSNDVYKRISKEKADFENMTTNFNDILHRLSDQLSCQEITQKLAQRDTATIGAENIRPFLTELKDFLKDTTLDVEIASFHEEITKWADKIDNAKIDEFLITVQEQCDTLEKFKNKLSKENIDQKTQEQMQGNTYQGYTFQKKIQNGAQGCVWSAKNTSTDEEVAIKVPYSSIDDDGSEPYCDVREIIISTLLNHPNIIKLKDIICIDSAACLVFELVKGVELRELIDTKKCLDECTAHKLFIQLVSAVNYMHENSVAHRDLKDGNIMVDAQNNVKIVDFGLGEFHDQEKLTEVISGSLAFSAPEIFDHAHVLHFPDVWSLGVILYRSTMGYLPFDSFDEDVFEASILSGQFVFVKPISESLRHLIEQILQPADKRMTIKEIIESEWFIQDNTDYKDYIKVRRVPEKIDKQKADLINVVLKLDEFHEHDEKYLEQIVQRTENDSELYNFYRQPFVKMYFLLEDKEPIVPDLQFLKDAPMEDKNILPYIMQVFVKIANGLAIPVETKILLQENSK